jgi:hypothetical protein
MRRLTKKAGINNRMASPPTMSIRRMTEDFKLLSFIWINLPAWMWTGGFVWGRDIVPCGQGDSNSVIGRRFKIGRRKAKEVPSSEDHGMRTPPS